MIELGRTDEPGGAEGGRSLGNITEDPLQVIEAGE